jgi:hypothetical protein
MNNQFLVVSLSILKNLKEFDISLDSFLFNLIHEFYRDYCISYGNSPSIIKHPTNDDFLRKSKELFSSLRTKIDPNGSHQRPFSWTDYSLMKSTNKKLSILDNNRVVFGVEGSIISKSYIVHLGNDHRDYLFSSPKWLRFDYCWLRKLTIPVIHSHKDIKKLRFGNKSLS